MTGAIPRRSQGGADERGFEARPVDGGVGPDAGHRLDAQGLQRSHQVRVIGIGARDVRAGDQGEAETVIFHIHGEPPDWEGALGLVFESRAWRSGLRRSTPRGSIARRGDRAGGAILNSSRCKLKPGLQTNRSPSATGYQARHEESN